MTVFAATPMTVFVNDQPRTLAAAAPLADLLRELGLAERKGVAIAINDQVVPRASWATRPLAEGERILVIQATQGG
jgi:sulfur carrier protein